MGHYWILFATSFILLPCTGCSKPVISPGGPHTVVPKGGRLELRCHDDDAAVGAQSGVVWQRERARRLDGEVEEGGVAYIKVSAAHAYHMGRYVCVNNSTLEHSSIYVYVKDPQNAFQRTMVNGILVRTGENCTLPCLVTDPNVSLLALETCDGRLLPSDLRYSSDPQRGVVITNARKEYEGCYVCVGSLGTATVKSRQYTVDVRLAESSSTSPCCERHDDDDEDDEEDEEHISKPKRNKLEVSSSSVQAPEGRGEGRGEISCPELLPMEHRITSFRDMMLERGVSAFSTWDKELHKMVFDPRYLLLTSDQRKQVFEQFVKSRVKEEYKEKRNKHLQAKEEFKRLLEEAKIITSFKEFSKCYGRDQRFRALTKKKEQEVLFNNYITSLKKRDKENRLRLRKMR